MKLAYVDEAGTSGRESVVVVAAVVINPDIDYYEIDSNFKKIKYELGVKDRKEKPVHFHATDLYHGNKEFDSKTIPFEKRYGAMEELASIPQKLDLGIAFGFIDKTAIDSNPNKKESSKLFLTQAYMLCMQAIEVMMRRFSHNGELAAIVAESGNNAQPYIKSMLSFQKTNTILEKMPEPLHYGLPFNRIIDTVHFTNKDSAYVLQLADLCAFLIKRFLTKSKLSEDLTGTLLGIPKGNNIRKLLESDPINLSISKKPGNYCCFFPARTAASLSIYSSQGAISNSNADAPDETKEYQIL